MKFFGAVFLLLLLNLSSLGEVATAAPLQIGYIPVESIEKGNQIAQVLLKNKLAMNPVVVPILKQDPKNPDPKAAKASNPPHLLLIETSALLIDHVKYVVAKAHKGSKSPPQVTFSPVWSSTPHLGVTVKDLPTQGSVFDDRDRWSRYYLWLEKPRYESTRINVDVGETFVFGVLGAHLPGYSWEITPTSSPAFSYEEFLVDGDAVGRFPGEEAALSLKITAKKAGSFEMRAKYVNRSNPSDNPVEKTVQFVFFPRNAQSAA